MKTPLVVVAVLLSSFLSVTVSTAHAARTVTLASMNPIPQVNGELTILGSVRSDAGVTVSIDTVSGGKWVAAGTATTDTDGTFLFTRPVTTAGANYFRAKIPADGDEPAVTSDHLAVFVSGEPADKFDSTSIPTIDGEMTVGSTLQAEPGSWSPKASYVAYRWNRNGVFTGTTGSKYVLTGSDLGAYVTVTVGGLRTSRWTFRDSRPTTRVARGAFTTTPPTIVGRAVVGETLRVQLDDWAPEPSGISHQWRRDGDSIDAATNDSYTLTAADAGTTLSVTVHATAEGVDPVDVTSDDFAVPGKATLPQRTFGDIIDPYSATPWGTADVAYTAGTTAPPWGTLKRTRWDAAGAFTHSQRTKPMGTLASAMFDRDWASPSYGAEYPGTNASLKNADVSFTITARRFAIAYRGNSRTDAMVWVDSKPIAAHPIIASGTTATRDTLNWVSVTLPARTTVEVRFAGPYYFTGVDVPSAENAVITATQPEFTLGVLSDSYYEFCADAVCASRNGAPALSTLTGFRVWNMSESGTGYVAASRPWVPGYEPGPFGSAKRLAGVLDAPIDALLIGGSMNDAYDVTKHAAAVHKLLDELESARPDLPVVLLGIQPFGPPKLRQGTTMTATLASMVGRHQNVVGFIDPYSDPWLTGTGSVGNPKGDGNRDQYLGADTIHVTAAGMIYYQQRVAAALRNLPLPAPE